MQSKDKVLSLYSYVSYVIRPIRRRVAILNVFIPFNSRVLMSVLRWMFQLNINRVAWAVELRGVACGTVHRTPLDQFTSAELLWQFVKGIN